MNLYLVYLFTLNKKRKDIGNAAVKEKSYWYFNADME